jgi:EAL domain-containing protein (putative c-di-GMP-specific phosphodiesterase class I)
VTIDHRLTRPGRLTRSGRSNCRYPADLIVAAQPIVDLSAGTVTQYELLLRIQAGPGATPLLPAAFLGTAERAGLLQLIDGWVVRQAVDLLARGRAARAFGLNVNVSAKSIGDPQFAAIVEDTLKETPIDPSLLVFELSETVALSDIDQARVFARRMQELGCRIALDDFGVGFGSFQYIKHLPFDVLKIDGEFVRDLTPGTIDQVVVKAIVGISTEMRKKTVAECVESAAMARFLKESGVDFAQGYYLGVPPRLPRSCRWRKRKTIVAVLTARPGRLHTEPAVGVSP